MSTGNFIRKYLCKKTTCQNIIIPHYHFPNKGIFFVFFVAQKSRTRWNYVMAYDLQVDRMSLIEHVYKIPGYVTHYNDDSDYDRFLTVQALRRMGT